MQSMHTTDQIQDVAVYGKGVRARAWSAMVTLWAVITGAAPHVLHHIAPIAGAALIGGVIGTTVFGVLAFLLTIPLLLRVRARTQSWRLPSMLVGLFAVMWLVSSLLFASQGGSAHNNSAQHGSRTSAGHNAHMSHNMNMGG